jgi:HSP20 family protein
MTITRFDPFRQVSRLQERMNRVFEDAFGRTFDEHDLFGGSWTPAVDIVESADALVLHAELPGTKPEEVDIRIENNLLTLKGERRFENHEDQGTYHRRERSYGTFARTFTLPTMVEQDKISAEYKEGVLTVTLPKKEETKPKQISIKIK